VIHDGSTAEVPCHGCTACCTSSQFVHIGPDETETLARIPPELRFPAPRMPVGHVVLGYDERGHCPMLADGMCTIYEHRPRSCRTYDCRVIAAAGVDLDNAQQKIADRVTQWVFTYPAAADRAEHAAVRAAATYLAEHRDLLPDGAAPRTATQMAALAVRLHRLFVESDSHPDADAVRAALAPPGPR
jgi:Fe-S-cluster containining protein